MKRDVNDSEAKKRILSAALRIFSQKGYDGAGIREICREAEINISMISYYFGGKQELYEAIISDAISAQLDYLKGRVDLFADYGGCSIGECRGLVYRFADLMIDFFYREISPEQTAFFIREQHGDRFTAVNPPAKIFLRQLLERIFEGRLTESQINCQIALLAAQITAPRILPLLNERKKDFAAEDIAFIRNNMRKYLDCIFAET